MTRASVDLDDPLVLTELGIRPSDVVRRNRDHTQEVANTVWQTHSATEVRGFSWWSYWRPEWTMVVLWSDGLGRPYFPSLEVTQVDPLTIAHPRRSGGRRRSATRARAVSRAWSHRSPRTSSARSASDRHDEHSEHPHRSPGAVVPDAGATVDHPEGERRRRVGSGR